MHNKAFEIAVKYVTGCFAKYLGTFIPLPGFTIGAQKPCTVKGQEGSCMFTSKCKERKGYVLGTCRLTNFIFGACCADEAVPGAADLSSNSSDHANVLSSIHSSIEKLLLKLDKPALILSNGSLHSLETISSTTEADPPQIGSMILQF